MPTSASVATAETIVIDASVVVTLLIDPGDIGNAIGARLEHADLIAPMHLPVEVTNVLRRRRNAALLAPTEATLGRDGLAELPLELWPWETVADRVWQLGNSLSSYDAAYVALAEQTGSPLLTRDKRIAGAPGVTCAVELS